MTADPLPSPRPAGQWNGSRSRRTHSCRCGSVKDHHGLPGCTPNPPTGVHVGNGRGRCGVDTEKVTSPGTPGDTAAARVRKEPSLGPGRPPTSDSWPQNGDDVVVLFEAPESAVLCHHGLRSQAGPRGPWVTPPPGGEGPWQPPGVSCPSSPLAAVFAEQVAGDRSQALLGACSGGRDAEWDCPAATARAGRGSGTVAGSLPRGRVALRPATQGVSWQTEGEDGRRDPAGLRPTEGSLFPDLPQRPRARASRSPPPGREVSPRKFWGPHPALLCAVAMEPKLWDHRDSEVDLAAFPKSRPGLGGRRPRGGAVLRSWTWDSASPPPSASCVLSGGPMRP